CTKPVFENKTYNYNKIKKIAVKNFHTPKDLEHIGVLIKDTFILELTKNNIYAVDYDVEKDVDAILSGVVIYYTPHKRYIVIDSTPAMQIYPSELIFAQDVSKAKLWFTNSEISFIAKLTSKDGTLLWQDEFSFTSWINALTPIPQDSLHTIKNLISRIANSKFFKKFSKEVY
ncbi:MAG: hypothetical protein NZ870_04220, partial [bacterium]|nr:hypothetical protein [bacterium]